MSTKPSDTGGLREVVSVAVGARVMVTVNIDVADGLVNGTFATVVGVDSTGPDVHTILVKFDSDRVGKQAITDSQYKQAYPGAVPIKRQTVQFFAGNNDLTIKFLNIRSYTEHLQDLKADKTALPFDVFCFVETFLHKNQQANLFLPHSLSFRADRVGRGGGVMTVARQDIIPTQLHIPVGGLEYTAITITKESTTVNIFGFRQFVQSPTTDYGSLLDHVYVRGLDEDSLLILGDYYLFKENNNVRRARLMDKDSERRLKAEHSVKMVKEQLPHTRELYVHEEGHRGVVFNDQMWGSQTYLHTGAVHMNLLPAWERTRKGEGVVVGVIDDGIFTNQPDLRDNLAAGLSYNVLQETTDPTPSFRQASHGTNCAGIIAAVHNNSFCGVGVAYKAKVSGIKMFSGAQAELSDAQEASALSHQYQSISVYSCSWGPSDWNNALEGPDTVAKEALVMAAREGRDGKGSVFVFSTGNGGSLNDSCAYNGYVNTNNTIGIGGLLQDGSIPSFAEACTSVFAVTLSRDYTGDTANMVVPHRATGCGTTFSGTSPAAALAAGVFTLVLSANDQLSVRDVQHLVTRTSTNTGVCGQTWKENSAGFRVSDYCGFGLLDAGKLTAMAANWSCVPEQVSCTQQGEGASVNIPQSGEVHTSITVQQDSCGVNYLEHVLLTVRATFPHRGHLQFRLTSPGGTVSDIVPGRAADMEPDLEWTFMTVHHWGERAEGTWQLSIRNTHPHLSNTGILEGWSLVFLGTATDPVNSSTATGSTPGTDTSIVVGVVVKKRLFCPARSDSNKCQDFFTIIRSFHKKVNFFKIGSTDH
ncbi:hypothetical protein Bbelb_056080 [Branchiostoma belcheri]|nr:hypothetical protein Bbelb_056080 [Branchiostoma belcheri]